MAKTLSGMALHFKDVRAFKREDSIEDDSYEPQYAYGAIFDLDWTSAWQCWADVQGWLFRDLKALVPSAQYYSLWIGPKARLQLWVFEKELAAKLAELDGSTAEFEKYDWQ